MIFYKSKKITTIETWCLYYGINKNKIRKLAPTVNMSIPVLSLSMSYFFSKNVILSKF